MDGNILIIDDDEKLQDLLKEYLQSQGYEVSGILDGRAAMEAIQTHQPDIIILDLMLPVRDGFEVLAEIRKSRQLPVIMLTARGEETDRIVGLEMGADDYLPKPFNPRELLARIKAILRRTGSSMEEERVKVNSTGGASAHRRITTPSLELDRINRVLYIRNAQEELTGAECKLLEVLMLHPEQALSRDELMNFTRGKDFMAFERSIDVHISKLRAVLKKHFPEREFIKTVWGTGYMFVDDPE